MFVGCLMSLDFKIKKDRQVLTIAYGFEHVKANGKSTHGMAAGRRRCSTHISFF